MRPSLALLVPALLLACSSERELPREPGTLQSPIVGGVLDDGAGAHPHVVMLSGGGSICSGTLVAPNLVLTAWHCVAPMAVQGIGCDADGNSLNGDHVGPDDDPSEIRVRTGVNPSGPAAARGAQIFHPSGRNLCDRDIALLLLDRDITGITPAPLRLSHLPVPGERATVVGYGITSDGGGGSGVRRRREQVEVLAAGKDWNLLLGSSELQLSVSGCSGDSGGPAFHATSGAVLGISSRVGDCDVGPLISTALAGHTALIHQAFAAAGHPLVNEGTPAVPTKTRATGEACSSGWECLGHVCNPNGLCTEMCTPSGSACPAGSLCVESGFEIYGERVETPLCDPVPDDGSCFGCQVHQCRLRMQDCARSGACLDIARCASACLPDDDACREACVADAPSGEAAYRTLLGCTCATSCADVCAVCEEPPGVGGTGGAPSTGGAAGAAGAAGVAGSSGAAGQGGAAGTGGAAGVGGIAGAAGAAPKSNGSSGDDSGCSVGAARGGASPLGWLSLLGVAWALRRARRGSRH
ncbi:MAG: trypsin-like serine protease [Polyangiaceae bacterium]|nr:trypsin-like serine protease [Polyangiaceae bacterium]MCW5792458.1 trypsin-like serine protease [Polyangiaceae bacterium]